MIFDKENVELMPSELEKETEKVIEQLENEDKQNEKKSKFDSAEPLAMFVRERFDDVNSRRVNIERRWLKDLRQYRGQYDQDVVERMDPNRSKAFVRLTRTKVKTVDSRLTDFLFPANGDKNWGIRPTPLPEYDKKQYEQLVLMHFQETGQMITPEELEQQAIRMARKQADKMAKVIADQLSEVKYREVLREVLHSGNLYGTGVLKGPMVSITENRQYRKDKNKKDTKWIVTQHDSLTPFVESVPIWDVYPDLSATKLDDCRFIVQRHKMDKHKLDQMARRSDFQGNKIRKYLKNNPDGDFSAKTHEVELQSMGDMSLLNSGAVDNSKKYELLEYWGFVDYEDLVRAGVEIPEKLQGHLELASCVWVLGNHVIKVSLAPMDGVKWPYFFYYYDKDETSIFGEGISCIMRDVQELVNSSFRAMLDNAAIAAGPQIEVNLDLLAEDEDPQDVRPFKVWMRHGDGIDSSYPAVRVTQLPSYTTEYLAMSEAFEKYGDEVTTIPRYMWGDSAGGAGRTASGLSMMIGSVNITIKDQVKNFDDGITKPFITAMYHWNMQFNDDESIKGDYSIEAMGTTSLIAKEVFVNSLIQFANITSNATDLAITKRPNIVRSIADALDLGDKDLVLSDKEIEVNTQQAQAQAREEREWMLKMTESAREYGISPVEMIENMRYVKQDIDAVGAQNAAAAA